MLLRLVLPAACLSVAGAAPCFAQTGEAAFFDRFDADGDGRVTEAEVQAWRGSFFDIADGDLDGYVTRAELDALRDAARERVGDGAGRGFGPRRRGGGGMARRDPIERHDADGDGRLTRAEFVEAPFQALERFDANGDGALSRDELPQPRRRRGG